MKPNFPPDFPKSRSKAPLVITAVTAGIAFWALVIIGIFSLVKRSGAYDTATAYIRNDAGVQQLTGGIKDFGFFPKGHVTVTNGSGSADLPISVNARRNDVDVHILLEKVPGGEWKVTGMEIIDSD